MFREKQLMPSVLFRGMNETPEVRPPRRVESSTSCMRDVCGIAIMRVFTVTPSQYDQMASTPPLLILAQ